MKPLNFNQGPAPSNPLQVNADNRARILNNSVEMIQQIFSASYTPASQNVVNIPIQNVGLVKGFIIEVNGTLANTGGSQASRSYFGAANALSNITFTDFQNLVRVNAPGWYLAMLATQKNGFVYGGAYTVTSPYDFGANWTVQSLASTIAATSGTAALRQLYWVPLAYSAEDLRGAIYAGVVQATATLQVTINTTPGFTSGTQLNAIAGGASTVVAWSGAVTITVYQVYLDQMRDPTTGKQLPLPFIDLSTQYLLIYSSLTGMTVSSDFGVQYPNLRSFLSTTAVFDNGGTFGVGADINYWALQSANQTYLWKYTPEISALLSRNEIMSDFPHGTYYFSHRRRPISTQTYGNMQLVLNASTVNAGATLNVGFEAFAIVNSVTQAGNLPTS